MTLTKSMWGAPSALVQLAIAGLVLAAAPVRAAETEWHDGFNSRTRLVSASLDKDGIRQSYAFVEVAMPKGWKTYWRNPGDAGGVPPGFDWSRSENLGSATVLYAAPHRLTDDAGDTIGYKDHVTFPVLVVAKDAKKPVRLALDMTFGICKDIRDEQSCSWNLVTELVLPARRGGRAVRLRRAPRPAHLRSGRLDAGADL